MGKKKMHSDLISPSLRHLEILFNEYNQYRRYIDRKNESILQEIDDILKAEKEEKE